MVFSDESMFKVLGNVLAIELDGLSNRDIVQFALGRLLGMVRKFMYGDASHGMAMYTR